MHKGTLRLAQTQKMCKNCAKTVRKFYKNCPLSKIERFLFSFPAAISNTHVTHTITYLTIPLLMLKSAYSRREHAIYHLPNMVMCNLTPSYSTHTHFRPFLTYLCFQFLRICKRASDIAPQSCANTAFSHGPGSFLRRLLIRRR